MHFQFSGFDHTHALLQVGIRYSIGNYPQRFTWRTQTAFLRIFQKPVQPSGPLNTDMAECDFRESKCEYCQGKDKFTSWLRVWCI